MIKKSLLIVLVLMFIIQFVYASVSDSLIFGKPLASRQADNTNLSGQQFNPGVVKILVYADYSYSLPKVNSINASPYVEKVRAGQDPSIENDVLLDLDKTKNMYDFWGSVLGQSTYSSDKSKPLLFGTGFLVSPKGYILTSRHLVKPSTDIFQTWTRIQILQTLEKQINLKNVNNNYSTYESYLEDVALYTFLGANLQLSISNIHVRVIVNGKEYTPQMIYSEGEDDFKHSESKDFALIKIDDENFSYFKFGDSSKVYSGQELYSLGYPSSSNFVSLSGQDNNYPYFKTNLLPIKQKINIFSGVSVDSFKLLGSDISEGQSGSPILDSDSKVIGMATFDYPSSLGGNSNYLQGIDYIKQKTISYINSVPVQNNSLIIPAKKESNHNFILVILILIFILAAVMGIIYYRSKNRVSDKILIITRPKPSIFSTAYTSAPPNLKIRTYS